MEMIDKPINDLLVDATNPYDKKQIYNNYLTEIMETFQMSVKYFNEYISSRNRIKTYQLTYDDPDANEIQVAFYQTVCYQNLINDSYIKKQYSKLGINNFFENLIKLVGPIRFMNIDDLNVHKIFILDNAVNILQYTNTLYDELYKYVSSGCVGENKGYSARVDWFLSVTNTAKTIIDTVAYALKSFLLKPKPDDPMNKNRPATGLSFNEIPTDVSTLREEE